MVAHLGLFPPTTKIIKPKVLAGTMEHMVQLILLSSKYVDIPYTPIVKVALQSDGSKDVGISILEPDKFPRSDLFLEIAVQRDFSNANDH